MKRESHLFASHKFLEAVGSQILLKLAKVDFRNLQEIKSLCNQIEDYVITIGNHSEWEKEFIFNKFFADKEISVILSEHFHLENKGKKIIEEFKALLNTDSQSRIYKSKLVYLDFRSFYAENLIHFHKEETDFLSMLQERATDDEIRSIDKSIYKNMSSSDIVEMLEQLFPPINIFEKKHILDDMKNFNSTQFDYALPEIRKILAHEQATEIFG